MHSSGYVSQSVIHLNLCHAIHPIGGVRANPLFKAMLIPHKQEVTTKRRIHFIFIKIFITKSRNHVVLFIHVSVH